MKMIFHNDVTSTRFIFPTLAIDRDDKGYLMITTAWWKWQVTVLLNNEETT